MKCLSVKWPWSLFIIYGSKDVENRSRKLLWDFTIIPGGLKLGIHCSKRPDLHWGEKLGWDRMMSLDHSPDFASTKKSILNQMYQLGFIEPLEHPIDSFMDDQAIELWKRTKELSVGKILGEVTLTEVRTDSQSLWADPGATHHIIIKPKPYKVRTEAKGKLGLWEFKTR